MDLVDVTQIIEKGLVNICRACLSDSEEMKPILNEIEGDRLLEMYTSCTALEINATDDLPKVICLKCYLNLNSAYEFKLQCQQSYQTLIKCVQSVLPKDKSELDFEDTCDTDGADIKIENDRDASVSEDESVSQSDDEDKDGTNVKSRNASNKVQKNTFSPDIVKQAIYNSKKKYNKRRRCRQCGFLSTNGRGLSLHVSHCHKELKDKWCNFCFEEVECLSEHLKMHTTKRNHECTFCEKKFARQGHLTEHMKTHSRHRPFQCNDCKKTFVFARHLRAHKRIHSAEKPYVCTYCDKRFMHKGSYDGHIRTHTGEKPFQCKVCDKKCTTSSSLTLHGIRAGHNSTPGLENKNKPKEQANKYSETSDAVKEETQECITSDEFDEEKIEWIEEYCETCNKNVQNLSEHLAMHKDMKGSDNIENTDEKQLSKKLCTACGKTFTNTYKLRLHMRVHSGETPYTCTYCQKQFRTRGQLVVHIRTHTGERPHICNFCGKGFAQSSVLNTHLRLHTGRPEECQICQQKFCRPAELKLHMRKHTGEKPYHCTVCGQSFIQRSHLMEHVKIHSDERPFKCRICGRGFKQRSSMRSHELIHSGYKPYKCQHCPYACRQPYGLTQHMKQHVAELTDPQHPHVCNMCQKSFSSLAKLTAHSRVDHQMIL